MAKTFQATRNLIERIEKIVDEYDTIVGESYEDSMEQMACESAQRVLDGLVDMLRAYRDKRDN